MGGELSGTQRKKRLLLLRTRLDHRDGFVRESRKCVDLVVGADHPIVLDDRPHLTTVGRLSAIRQGAKPVTTPLKPRPPAVADRRAFAPDRATPGGLPDH